MHLFLFVLFYKLSEFFSILKAWILRGPLIHLVRSQSAWALDISKQSPRLFFHLHEKFHRLLLTFYFLSIKFSFGKFLLTKFRSFLRHLSNYACHSSSFPCFFTLSFSFFLEKKTFSFCCSLPELFTSWTDPKIRNSERDFTCSSLTNRTVSFRRKDGSRKVQTWLLHFRHYFPPHILTLFLHVEMWHYNFSKS